VSQPAGVPSHAWLFAEAIHAGHDSLQAEAMQCNAIEGVLVRRWVRAPVQIFAVAVVGLACASAAPPRFPAKPSGCVLETLSTRPERPFIELETFALPSPESMQDVVRMVQERACQDGADAIYAPKGGRGYSYAIALKWNAASAP
jgi:hypothetical protein